MWKIHLGASAAVLIVAFVWIFYLLDPFAGENQNTLLLSGTDSVQIGELYPGLPAVKSTGLHTPAEVSGYLCGRDRSAQLAVLAVALRGEMSVNFGNEYLWHDVWVKNLNLPVLANQLYSELTESEKKMLGDYAAGINSAAASTGFRMPLTLLNLHLKPQPWQAETVLQSIIFWLAESVRRPIYEDALIGASIEPRTASVLKSFYPQSLSLNGLYQRKKWDIFSWQESLFYPEIMQNSDGVIKKNDDCFFTLYAPNRYPMSYYPLVYNHKLQICLPGLPFAVSRADSVSVFAFLRKSSLKSRIKFIARAEYEKLPSRLFEVRQQGKTAQEYLVRDLPSGFSVCQNAAGDSLPFFSFAKNQLASCVKTLLGTVDIDKTVLSEFGLRVFNSTDSIAAGIDKASVPDSVYKKIPQLAFLQPFVPGPSTSLRLKRAFYLEKMPAPILPGTDKTANFEQSFRRMNSQLLPVVTIKFSPGYPKLELLLLNGAAENPTGPSCHYFYPYWQAGLFLPLI